MMLLYISGGIAVIAILAYYLHIRKSNKKSKDYQDMIDTIIYSDKYKVKGQFETR